MAKGAAEGLGIIAVLRDFGLEAKLEIHSDATAAIGIANRQGLGRIRHIAVADLWIQQRLLAGDFTMHKVSGKDNTSDLMTKALDGPRITELLQRLRIGRCSYGEATSRECEGE